MSSEEKAVSGKGPKSIWKTIKTIYLLIVSVFAPLFLTERILRYIRVDLVKVVTTIVSPAKNDAEILVVFPNTKVGQDIKHVIMGDNEEKGFKYGVRLRSITEDNNVENTEQKIMTELKKNKNILMIIGHETSTSAKHMIENVYRSDYFMKRGGPIPLILPAVTNPDLTKNNEKAKHILRLPATDSLQADKIKEFIRRKNAKAALIVDSSNYEYSHYIAKSIINTHVDYVVDSVGVDLDGSGFMTSRFIANQPDFFAFIGMHTQGSLFLKSMILHEEGPNSKSNGNHRYTYLFTDGVVSEFFSNFLKATIKLRPIYITAPIPLKPIYLRPGSPIQENELSYKEMGVITLKLVERILERAHENNHFNRKGVLKEIGEIIKNTESINFTDPYEISIRFNYCGENELGKVHLFRYQNGHFYHAEDCGCVSMK